MTTRVRVMTHEDKPEIMGILRSTPEFNRADVELAEELIDAYLQNPQLSGYLSLVAELDSFVTGYICYGPTPLTEDTWDIYWLAVNKEKQGQGIGSALMAATEGEIKEAAGRLILIETSSTPEYERTRRFYLRLGYGVVCRIPDFYKPGDDLVTFMKRLR